MRFIYFASLALVLVACGTPNPAPSPVSDTTAVAQPNTATFEPDASTAAMAKQLAQLYNNLSPGSNAYLNARNAQHLETQLAKTTDVGNRVRLRFTMATQYLMAGDTRKAIELTQALKTELAAGEWAVGPQYVKLFDSLLGISYMRLGEQENCQHNHTNESCIMPFSVKAQHTLPEGSRKAIEHYQQFLKIYPNDPVAVWLLNVAYMTLGEHPEKVPTQWRIPASAFESDYELPRFTDVAANVGLNVDALSGGAITEDFNNDGLLDVLCSSWRLTDQVRYYENAGDGSFTDQTARAGLEGITGSLNMLQADYNNDGFVDVLMLRGAWVSGSKEPNSLLRNNGDGTFTDVTRESGIYSERPTQTATFADFNNDGWLDLAIGNESTTSSKHPIELFQSNRDGTFTEVGTQAGLSFVAMTKGITSGDVNNDGLPDLYLSNMSAPNALYINQGVDANGQVRFTEQAASAGVQEPANSFPTWMFDYDNDGHLDIFVASYDMRWYNKVPAVALAEYINQPINAEHPRLYRNKGNGTFEDVTAKVGLNKPLFVMGCNFGDLDNDGYPDLYLGTGEPDFQAIVPNRMFRNNAGTGFQDVTTSGGFGHLQKGHGVAFADLDNDGDQDVYATMGGAYEGDNFQNVLFLNPGMGNNWLTLRLQGAEANHSAIGARIAVSVSGPDGKRTIYKMVSSGGSFGAGSLQQEIGLGKADAVDAVTVTWPGSKTPQVWSDLKVNGVYVLEQGAAKASQVSQPAMAFPTEEMEGHVHHHH